MPDFIDFSAENEFKEFPSRFLRSNQNREHTFLEFLVKTLLSEPYFSSNFF
jgi:hypothetical protein